MNNDIQVIKTNGSFNLFVNKDEKKVSYQSLESVVDEFNLTLEENASLELLTFNNGSTNNVTWMLTAMFTALFPVTPSCPPLA